MLLEQPALCQILSVSRPGCLVLTILMNWKVYGAENLCVHASAVSDLGQFLVVSESVVKRVRRKMTPAYSCIWNVRGVILALHAIGLY